MVTVLLTILVFGVIITLHELGHFIFAKLFGVKVNEFSFGMGPKLWGRKKGETDYSIRLLPIGGYVAMEGEDASGDEPVDSQETEDLRGRRFTDKKPWQRFIILAAGAVMNIILGLFLLLFLTSQMDLLGTNVVVEITPDSPAAAYLQPYDRIVSVNGHRTGSYNDVTFQLMRDEDGLVDIGVSRGADPKATLPMLLGEKQTELLSQVPFELEDAGNGRSMIKLNMMFAGLPNSFAGTLSYSVNWTVSVVKQVWFSLVDIVTGRYGLNDISGPVGTAVVIEEARSYGFESMFFLIALITINVGVFNLLPVPALDGGRLLFVLIEAIFRRPVPQKYETLIHATGMFLLLGFILVVTFNDIWKLIKPLLGM